ncbi:MAG: short-chain oxidoreductase [Planctomycetia bacterium]|nr:short-chain oxidoreductase [Planctomycetia bacterium]
MQLDDILQGDPALLYMERYVDEGTRTYSPFAAKSEVGAEYQPRSSRPSFDLVTVVAPRARVALFQAGPQRDLLEFYVQPEEVRFLIHPETWASPGIDNLDVLRTFRRGEPVQVAPTASTRTVYTTATPGTVPAHFIKLHYPRRISRFNRRLRLKNIRNSIEATRDLEHVRFERFAYLPDSLGCTCGGDGNPWGFLVRERIPRPVQEARFLIPCFALYGGDLRDPQNLPLLTQMIERLGADPQAFVIEEIMLPVLECWARVVRERGILLESHAQNVLLEVDQDFRPLRVVHRDFDVWVDDKARKNAGLQDLGASISADSPYPREQHYSLVYDHFIGREFFGYLLQVLTRFYAASEREVRNRIAEAFHEYFPDADEFFPSATTYYFSNELLPGNDFKLVDMKQAPEWR